MPLSGGFNVRHLLSSEQRVKMSIVDSFSSFASNAKGGQSFQLQSPHIFLKESEQRERVN